MATDDGVPPPGPPPEAVLLRLARKAAGKTVTQAAAAAGISKAWLSAIENGYDKRGPEGSARPVQASDADAAHLAAFLNVDADRLEAEGQRPDAAAVLREMQRSRPPAATGLNGHLHRPPDPDGYTRPAYADSDLEAFARRLERDPGMAVMLHRDIDQAVKVMEVRKRMLTAEARVAELEAENAVLRAEVGRLRGVRERRG